MFSKLLAIKRLWFFSLKKILYFEKGAERERLRQILSIHWFTPQLATVAIAGPD